MDLFKGLFNATTTTQSSASRAADLSAILSQIALVLPATTATSDAKTTTSRPPCPLTWYEPDAHMSSELATDVLKFKFIPPAKALAQASHQFRTLNPVNRNIILSKFSPKVSRDYPTSSHYASPHGLAVTALLKRLQQDILKSNTFTVVFPKGSSDASSRYPRGLGDGTVYGVFTALDCPAGPTTSSSSIPASGVCVCIEEQNLAGLPRFMIDRLAVELVQPAPLLLSPDTIKHMICRSHAATDLVICDVPGMCDDVPGDPFDGTIVGPSVIVRFAIMYALYRVALHGTLIFVLNCDAWDAASPGKAEVAQQLVYALASRFERFTTWTSCLSPATFLIFHGYREPRFTKSQTLSSVAIDGDTNFLSSIQTARHVRTKAVIQQSLDVMQGRWCEYAASVLQYQIALAGSIQNGRLPDTQYNAIRTDYDTALSDVITRRTPVNCRACHERESFSVMEKDMWQTVSAVITKAHRLSDHSKEGQSNISGGLALRDQAEGGGWKPGALGYRVRTGGKLGVLTLGFGDDDAEVRLPGCSDGIVVGEERITVEPSFCKGLPRPCVVDIVYHRDIHEISVLDVWIVGGMPEIADVRSKRGTDDNDNDDADEKKKPGKCLRHAPVRAVYAMELKERMQVRDQIQAHLNRMPCVVNVHVSWPLPCTASELEERDAAPTVECLGKAPDDDLFLNLCDGRKDANVERHWNSWRVWKLGSWIDKRVREESVALKKKPKLASVAKKPKPVPKKKPTDEAIDFWS